LETFCASICGVVFSFWSLEFGRPVFKVMQLTVFCPLCSASSSSEHSRFRPNSKPQDTAFVSPTEFDFFLQVKLASYAKLSFPSWVGFLSSLPDAKGVQVCTALVLSEQDCLSVMTV
jgi:hypothetical protein